MLDPDQTDICLFVSMNLGTASGFVTGSFPNIMISPKRDPQDIGTFPISVTIKDNNKISQSMTYSFNIIIKAPAPSANSTSNSSTTSTTNSSSSSTANSTTTSNTLSILSSLLPSVKKNPMNKNLKSKPIELTASLSVTNAGIATIKFNKDVYAIANITAIDSSVLGISVVPGAESDPNDLNITRWNVTGKKI